MDIVVVVVVVPSRVTVECEPNGDDIAVVAVAVGVDVVALKDDYLMVEVIDDDETPTGIVTAFDVVGKIDFLYPHDPKWTTFLDWVETYVVAAVALAYSDLDYIHSCHRHDADLDQYQLI